MCRVEAIGVECKRMYKMDDNVRSVYLCEKFMSSYERKDDYKDVKNKYGISNAMTGVPAIEKFI